MKHTTTRRTMQVETTQHGGARPNAGRRTRFPNKKKVPTPLWLTDTAARIMRTGMRRERASMADFVEGLIREHAATIALPPMKRAGTSK